MRKYSEELKKEYLEEFRNSGKSVNAFSKEKGISRSTFNKWLCKSNKKKIDVDFGVIENVANDKIDTENICIVMPGINIELKANYDKELLKKIFEVLL